MSTFQRRGHTRKSASGKVVRVAEHQVTRDSRAPFVGSGLTGSISRNAVSASQYTVTHEHPVHLDTTGELAEKRQHSSLVPNARCPVCNAVVFYFCNSYGSGVFFDQIGKPWPKHPCTDLAYVRNKTGEAIEPVIRNQALDVYRDIFSGQTIILRVAERSRYGLTTGFTLVDPIRPEGTLVWETREPAPRESIGVGQIVYIEGNYLSCLDGIDSEPRIYFGGFRELSHQVNLQRAID